MKTTISPKNKKELVNQLFDRFSADERMTSEAIIIEFFDPKTTQAYLEGKEIVKSLIKSVKKRFRTQGVWFGSINDLRSYGLPLTKAEYRYAGLAYYSLQQGLALRSKELAKEGGLKGLLDYSEERVTVQRVLPEPVTSSPKKLKGKFE